jgi:5-methyltetrahydrofolate--homocysteine methyltransferase
MTDWLSQCAERVLIIDGAMGTQLQARGLPPGECPEKWARDNPVQLAEVHAAYAKAGADMVMTFTFGGSSIKLAEAGLDGETEAINWALARVARDAAPNAVLLGGLGPTGALIAPLGDKSADEVRAAFGRQITGLADVVDGFIIETMSDLDETALALEACKQAAPDKPVLASLTYELDHDGRGYHTFMGVTPEVAAKRLEAAGADAIGTNCGNGIDDMIGIVGRLAASTCRPVFAEPNAGLPKLRNGQTVFDESAESMAGKVSQLIDAGARIIGGCCGTTPQHIVAMKAAVEGR